MMDDSDPRSLIIPILGTKNGHYLLLVIHTSASWCHFLKAPQLQQLGYKHFKIWVSEGHFRFSDTRGPSLWVILRFFHPIKPWDNRKFGQQVHFIINFSTKSFICSAVAASPQSSASSEHLLSDRVRSGGGDLTIVVTLRLWGCKNVPTLGRL